MAGMTAPDETALLFSVDASGVAHLFGAGFLLLAGSLAFVRSGEHSEVL